MRDSNYSILLVDDDQSVLDGLCRQHRKQFNIIAARGPEAGIEALSLAKGLAVIVSDYQMPGMNGAEFLAKAREISPDISRVMLTGQADMTTAVDAVNRGSIFRFLTKPCDPELFRAVINDGIEQYELRSTEKLLMEQTVRGCIQVLAEVLALSNPAAFGRATRIKDYVLHITKKLDVKNTWQFEAAALLSQIGCVAVPDDVFERISRGESISPDQMAMLDRHPRLARDLLAKIPRLKRIAEMVYHQRGLDEGGTECTPDVKAGAQILHAASAFEELVSLGATPEQAVNAMLRDEAKFNRRLLRALSTAEAHEQSGSSALVSLSGLKPGMVLDEEIRNTDGMLIVPSGHQLTISSIQRLRNYGELGFLEKGSVRVRQAGDGQESDASAA